MPIALIGRLSEDDLEYIKRVGVENLNPQLWTHPQVMEMMLKEEIESKEE